MNKKTTEIYFYFDSKNIFTILVKNQIPEIYECFDKGNEFECWIKVENSGSLKTFLKHLKDITGLPLSEIVELTNEMWDGYGFDELNEVYGEEKSNDILDDSYEYLESLYK
tara:strand:+ start:1532 stop:1864 length:333 start_codon:yes stop_codon:yes gene_type:complete